MTDTDRAEYLHLINLWNCTEPMTKEQTERLAELDAQAIAREKEYRYQEALGLNRTPERAAAEVAAWEKSLTETQTP